MQAHVAYYLPGYPQYINKIHYRVYDMLINAALNNEIV
jgi:hypothetical protein